MMWHDVETLWTFPRRSGRLKRTACIKLDASAAQVTQLVALQVEFARACRHLATLAAANTCHNRVKLHHLGYYELRARYPALGAQMACNAVAAVSAAYASYFSNNPAMKKQPWPVLAFRVAGSVHFDKRTYALRGQAVSLFTLDGRQIVPLRLGAHQAKLMAAGAPKEAELVRRGTTFYLHLVFALEDPPALASDAVLGVDVGENVIAATSSGKRIDGGQLRFDRDRHLALRARLQGNGSPSAKQRLKTVSGRERRPVTHVNHVVSKQLVAEALKAGSGVVALEDLTHIRKRIKAGVRVRARLHRWAWRQLQGFIEDKARAAGLRVVYVDPAYTSQTCSVCLQLGTREKHRFSCTCGRLAHSDLNSSQNLARLGATAVAPRGAVTHPHVGA